MSMSDLSPASLRMVLSSLVRGLPRPKYFVAAVRAATGMRLGNCPWRN